MGCSIVIFKDNVYRLIITRKYSICSWRGSLLFKLTKNILPFVVSGYFKTMLWMVLNWKIAVLL